MLSETNHTQQEGLYSNKARDLIRNHINNVSADIHFVTGGTQANQIVISSALKSYESVIAATTGHINVHKAGAIEATGHKINTVQSKDGKVKIEAVQAVLDEHVIIPHMVKPKMIYISDSTETGTVYKKNEPEKLSQFCKENDIYLFLDGARLGAALTSQENDLEYWDLLSLINCIYCFKTFSIILLLPLSILIK